MRGDKPIKIYFVDSEEQRYNTCGDYWETDNEIIIKITKQVEDKRNLLILIHEMVEYMLCEDRGIKEEDIMKFDLEWNKQGPFDDELEPGDSKWAPYKKEHRTAENFERLLAEQLNIDWTDYENNLII